MRGEVRTVDSEVVVGAGNQPSDPVRIAGVVFSRDREFVRKEASLAGIYDFVISFFFIGIGLHIDPNVLDDALGLGGLLMAAAFVGKLLGTALPALPFIPWRDGLVLGLSMVPHAEVTMIILSRGREIAGGVVSPELYAAGVMAVAVTSTVPPLLGQRVASVRAGARGPNDESARRRLFVED
jgi:Kef-type K+ transport system membrane component KefB